MISGKGVTIIYLEKGEDIQLLKELKRLLLQAHVEEGTLSFLKNYQTVHEIMFLIRKENEINEI